jgi:hypothetical protein
MILLLVTQTSLLLNTLNKISTSTRFLSLFVTYKVIILYALDRCENERILYKIQCKPEKMKVTINKLAGNTASRG